MSFDVNHLFWLRQPKNFTISNEKIEIITESKTDLWSKTYYDFTIDNAPLLQMKTEQKLFSFTVKSEFEPKKIYDQCGIIVYLDTNNWLKASMENKVGNKFYLGSVLTSQGYSDWSTHEIENESHIMWYRLSRKNNDFRIETSNDGKDFSIMRMCHMNDANGEINFGIYACSPQESSFKAIFTDFQLGDYVTTDLG